MPGRIRTSRAAHLHPDSARRHVPQASGGVEVGGFLPALAGACHAADDDGEAGRRMEVGEAALQDSGKALLACRRHALIGVPLGQHDAAPVEEPKAKARRAPVDGGAVGGGCRSWSRPLDESHHVGEGGKAGSEAGLGAWVQGAAFLVERGVAERASPPRPFIHLEAHMAAHGNGGAKGIERLP